MARASEIDYWAIEAHLLGNIHTHDWMGPTTHAMHGNCDAFWKREESFVIFETKELRRMRLFYFWGNRRVYMRVECRYNGKLFDSAHKSAADKSYQISSLFTLSLLLSWNLCYSPRCLIIFIANSTIQWNSPPIWERTCTHIVSDALECSKNTFIIFRMKYFII